MRPLRQLPHGVFPLPRQDGHAHFGQMAMPVPPHDGHSSLTSLVW
jgi:hypothetical protein